MALRAERTALWYLLVDRLSCSFVSMSVCMVSSSGGGLSQLMYCCMLCDADWHRSANSLIKSFPMISCVGVLCNSWSRIFDVFLDSSTRDASSVGEGSCLRVGTGGLCRCCDGEACVALESTGGARKGPGVSRAPCPLVARHMLKSCPNPGSCVLCTSRVSSVSLSICCTLGSLPSLNNVLTTFTNLLSILRVKVGPGFSESIRISIMAVYIT